MKIDTNTAQDAQYDLMIELGAKIHQVIEHRGGKAALKGGTALKLLLGLPRPSTDLDFEGTVGVYSALGIVREAARQLSTRWQDTAVWRKAWRWFLSPGTVEVKARDARSGRFTQTKVDYRRMGSRPGIPQEFDESTTTVVQGIRVYKTDTLIQRKLGALIGPTSRVAARDGFDTVILRFRHREELTSRQIGEIDRWMDEHGPESKHWSDWVDACRDDPVMREIGWEKIWRHWMEESQEEKQEEQRRRPGRASSMPDQTIIKRIIEQRGQTPGNAGATHGQGGHRGGKDEGGHER